MPAPDIATLLFPPVEEACKKLFTTPPKLVDAFMQRESGELTAERVDIQFTRGAWSGRWGVDSKGDMHHSCWHYTLQLDLWTKRLAKDKTRHATIRAQIHGRLEAAVLDPNFLAFHTLASLDEISSTEQLEAEDDMDCSSMKFGGLVTVRSDSWP
jgi:hypothetical protein